MEPVTVVWEYVSPHWADRCSYPAPRNRSGLCWGRPRWVVQMPSQQHRLACNKHRPHLT